MSKKVTFSVSTGYVGSKKEDEFTLDELGIDENQSDKEIEKELDEAFNEWVWENISGSWAINDD